MEKSHRHTRRTSEKMFPLVERYESSGQPQKEFCEQHGVSIGTFQYWMKKYRNQQADNHTQPFQQITVLPDQSGRYIMINTPSGVEIKIPLD